MSAIDKTAPRRRHRRLSPREVAISDAITGMPDEFTTKQLADQLGYTTKSQRDELRRTLMNRSEEMSIEIRGHTISRLVYGSPGRNDHE